mmetsp:Transcript_20460/g.45522  ORF Transcript_20460/g.45522 Transcript_20460/m.45522 type:complete len:212 (+) Transcript_20460:942-1577(+)
MRVRTCCCGSAVGAATTPILIVVAISSISMPIVAVATVRATAVAVTVTAAAAVAIPTTPSSTSVMRTIPPPRQRSVVIIMTALIRQTRHPTLPHLDALSISSLEVVERLRRGIVGGVLGTRQRVVVAVIGPTVGGTSISAVTGSSSSSTTTTTAAARVCVPNCIVVSVALISSSADCFGNFTSFTAHPEQLVLIVLLLSLPIKCGHQSYNQ